MQAKETLIDAHYNQQFGVLAGYLPQDRDHLDDWLRELQKAVAEAAITEYEPTVKALGELIVTNGIVRMYVTRMIEQVPLPNKTVFTIGELLQSLNHIITRAPAYNNGKLNFPMSALFVYMMFTPGGAVAFRNEAFNSAIRVILQRWCALLDSKASLPVINKKDGWLSPMAYKENKLDEFIIPDWNAEHGGFTSFNAYFHRQIKPECRPIAGPDDSKIIVSPNDGTVYNIARNVKASDEFWIKSQPYSLINMLDNMYVDEFVGGDVLQAFLSGANYHRFHSPVKGKVIAANIVNGLMFSELHVEGFDKDAGTMSQGFEASVNTRGLVFIKADDPAIGMVCVIPIGITEISSIVIEVKVGAKVSKGEELGYFSYGGSTLCTVFQQGAINHFTKEVPPPGESGTFPEKYLVHVNGKIAVAN